MPSPTSASAAAAGVIWPFLHLLAKRTGPAVVCFAVDDIARYLVSNDPLTHFIYICVSIVFDKLLYAIYLIDILQKAFECLNQCFVGRTCHEL